MTVQPRIFREKIIDKILFLRGQKVILDRDIAALYEVETKVLNQAVKRNIERFPSDFMFKLTEREFSNLKMRFRETTSKGHGGQRALPIAFTEQGVAMLSSILHSRKAIEMNIAIIRTFVHLRNLIQTNSLLAEKIKELESKTKEHDQGLKTIYKLINQLIIQEESPKKAIGFKVA